AFWFARPTAETIGYGMSVAGVGEALRIWASGHILKGREITRSGPYRFTRHPLYLGSLIMSVGFVVAARSWISFALVMVYMGATLYAATRTEEAVLDERFDGAYSAYRAGRAEPQHRRFSVKRAIANREYRAAVGLAIGAALLVLRMTLMR